MHSEGIKRRKAIVEYLQAQATPVKGTELARFFHVSRQVIVQDIALLRAENRNVLSTNKGYLLFRSLEKGCSHTAVVMVRHTLEQTRKEMRSIVDYGGRMLDVFIEHDLYGQIRAELAINDLEDAEDFCRSLESSTSRPLLDLTEGWHCHTVAAPSEKALQLILQELRGNGILP
ncbi:MAG: transcription repressor NadR [Clostridium sp.]|jgi:transcriptional regulator of NAD metabolism|nr:transcription repressor NadR [Clostridium sp.]